MVIFYREYGMVMNLCFKQGCVISLTRTATGKLFAAYMPKAQCDEIIQQQTFTRDAPTLFNCAEFPQTLFDETRMLNLEAESPTVTLLRQQAAALSESLGFKP